MAHFHTDRKPLDTGEHHAQQHVRFWREHLAAAPALLELPADRSRPARQSRTCGQAAVAIGPELTSALHEFCTAHRITLEIALLAAWSALLSRLSGQAEVVVGLVQPGTQTGLVPLLVRTGLAPSPAALVAAIDHDLGRARAHCALPFAELAASLAAGDGGSYHPLCQAMLACDAPAHDAGSFDIALVLASGANDMQGYVAFATDLFDATTAAGFARCFGQLLASMLADPGQPLAALEILPPAERERLLGEWNATARNTGPFATAHQAVDAQIARTPDAIALRHGGRSMSYRELGQRADAVAQALLDAGVRPGELVALFVQRSPEMVVGLLGILKAGAGYVPVDPSFPAARVAYMLEDAAARCVVTERALAPHLPAGVTAILSEDIVPSTVPVSVAVDPSSVSYVIYTSGSTGKPKGVLLPHRAMVNLFAAITDWPGMTAADTIVAVTTLSFDISLVEVLVPLTVGARIEIADAATAADGAALARLADACGATMMQATPATWRMLLDAGWQGRAGLRIITGGEPMPRELADRLLARVAQLWNLYGPSETTTYSTGERIFADGSVVTIGKPVANTQAYIVDRHLQLVPPGVPGELLLGGHGVGIGYNARPELTAEKFIANPFPGTPGERVYRTGDLARWTRDGRIELLGRIDNQVKLRGYRIELGEIESLLAAHADVRQAVVVCREDRPGDKRLVAYLRAGAALPLAEVRARLAEALPAYMMPSAFVVLDEFPLTPTGKVDRRSLPAPSRAALAAGDYAAPQGEHETVLATLWQELLGVERAGRHDDFFALGGHSLLAGQLIARLRSQRGAALALRDLFEHPTPAGLAPVFAAAAPSGWTPIGQAGRAGMLPLSSAQQRLWFLDQLDAAAGAAYHLPLALVIDGKLDRGALVTALDALVQRHESLRTTFTAADGVPCQRIHPPGPMALVEADLRGHTPAEREAFIAAEIARPFSLADGPLVRALLARTGDAEHQLLLVQHHIISDGWSLSILQRELAALYAGEILPPLPLQYADYAAWLQSAPPADTMFWQNHLAGAPELLELPTDRPRPARQSHRGGQVPIALPAELTARLRSFSQEHGATLFMTLLAAWGTLLGRYSGQDDIVIGTPAGNRPRPELEAIAGFFVNTLALRVRLDGQPCAAQLLERVRAATLDAYAHQDVPFERVVEALAPTRNLAYAPVFQAALAVNNTPPAASQAGMRRIAAPLATTHFDIALLLDDDGDAVDGHIEFASDLFERASIERLGAAFQVLLASMLDEPARPVERLDLLTAPQRERIVEGFNRTAADFPREALVHELFEAQAASRPDAPALAWMGERISYAQLDERANRLANALVAAGVQPSDRVALVLERSAQMVCAMLAVLKAGAAYLPIEPSCPPARMDFILSDAAPALIVSNTENAPKAALPALLLDRDASLIAEQPATAPRVDASARSLAYVIYTSGSTGTPKGVMVEHRSVVRLVVNNDYARLGTEDCVAHCANPAFDASTWEIWGPLVAGARILVVPQPTLLDPHAFGALLVEGGVTGLFLTIGLFNEYADQLEAAFSRLTWLMVGGDVLDPQRIVRAASKPQSPRHFLAVYGPTEVTTFSTAFRIGTLAGDAHSVPIGKPIANTTAYILDAHMQPVPVGVVGEIWLGGEGVARGYLNRPDLTAERFVEGFGGQRLYRSGDLGKWLDDGNIEFMGRNDLQVKIRGFRIELGDIEAQLHAQPGIAQAAVLCREDQPGDKRLVAYLAAGASVDLPALRARLAETLPAYMIPSAFVPMERLPLTANGKLDRRALPAPGADALAAQAYEAPQSEQERAVAQAFADLLGAPRAGRHDSFFELGGHSLLAVRLIARLGGGLTLAALFQQPTVAGLAAAMSAGAATRGAIAPADRNAPLRPSYAQQRLWFLNQLDPAAGLAYHIPAAWRFEGALDRDALVSALGRIMQRHESLRTTFTAQDGVPLLRIAEDAAFPLREVDLYGRPDSEKAALFAAETAQAFDLEHGPLIRGLLVRLAPQVHELLLVQHHIVSDGWSLSVLLGELAALYSGRPLAPLAIQYADYAAAEQVSDEHLAYWRAHLEGAPALLELPADRPRPARQSYNGGQAAVHIDATLTAALRQLGKAHGVTLYMTLLAAWAVLLSRLSGQLDVVIGAPVANRERAEVEPLIGFFVNTLALRVTLEDDPVVAGLLARLKSVTLAGLSHQDAPFDQVVEALKPARSLSYSPLFQTMLSLNNTPLSNLSMDGLRVSEAAAPAGKSQVDLSLFLTEDGDTVRGHIAFASDLFDHATVSGFADCLLQLLASMAANPAQRVSALDILSQAERRKLLVEWNDTVRDSGTMVNAHDVIRAQVLRSPDAIALRHHGRAMSYRELDQRANGIAAALLARGVQPGDLVALFIRRSPEMIAGILGILKAGAGYVPVDPSFPADRVAYMLEDSAARCVVSEHALAAFLPAAARAVLVEETGARAEQVHVSVDPASVSYVIYTSGSTGRPKGVLLPHRAMVNLFTALTDWPGMNAGDVIVAVTTLSFDISIVEVLLPLTVGARIEIADSSTAADGAALAQLADDCGATMLQATPASWRMLLDAGWQGRPGLKCITGGEPLPRELADRLLARVGQLWNLYGPSETTTYSTGERVLPDGIITIGKPVANTVAYIVDRNMQPVPVGVAGELLLGGHGVGIGYNARPELTAEKFIADPFSGVPGARLYRTGDLVRWTRDGRIEMLGRIDNQVKLRGFRIELGEIDTVLAGCDGVRQAVVLCREDRPGDKRLVAYVAGANLDLDGMRASLAKSLPSYMIPSAFVVLDQFPLTPTGKVDRRSLPAPDRSAVAASGFEAPAGAQEEAVAGVWRELLGLDQVGRHDNFFAIGGHSLLAGQLVARLRKQFGADLALRDLFSHPTVAELSAALAKAGSSAWSAIAPADRKAPLPLSLAQQRLWFLDQLDAAAGLAYHMPLAWRLEGELDEAALRAALAALVGRHESLRTHFEQVDGVPRQVIGEARVELALADAGDGALAAHIAQPFDLARGPLMRALLVRVAPRVHELAIVQHHIVSDGWSLGVMMSELAALYNAFRRAQPDPLPALPLQYADYAAWQSIDPRHVDYWRSHLAGAPALLELPTDRPRPARQSYRGGSVDIALAPELVQRLRAFSQERGATLFMTLLAGWSALLSRFAGQDEIVVGTPVANRPRPELEGLIGFFVNTLALRVDLRDDPDADRLLARIRECTMAGYAHQEVPLDQVVDAVRPDRSLAYSPLFQTVLALNNTPPADSSRFDGLRLSPVALPHSTTHFDLSLLLDDDGATVGGQIEYASDLFERATIERLAASLQVLLGALVDDPARTVSRLPLLPAAERARILAGFNDTAAPYPRDSTVHAQFERQADATPHAIALEFDGQRLTYQQLDQRANRMAHALLAMGVQPDDRVAVILERSADLVTAMLAILKAGASYLPVETSCPAERLAYILDDAAPRAVISAHEGAHGLPLLRPGQEAGFSDARPAAKADSTSLAYVIYTSGSTGMPKGVMIEHRNVLRLAINGGFAPVGPEDCIAHCANPAFDASTWEIWAALLNGARVLVVPQATLLDPKALNRALADGGVTALWLTAGLFNEYAARLEEAFGKLTWLMAGGDVLDPATVARVTAAAQRPRHLLNGYGPTETTTFATTHAVGDERGASIPIGRPIGNTQVYILDRHLEPVPVGVAGEIHIGGDGVARGYLNQPGLTAERFIADPFGAPGARMYRSGDLGRWLADGSIEFIGRNDFQVKIRGFRIEPGEIEAKLAACEGVREALVLAREDVPGEKSLVAYITGDADAGAVRRALKAALPAYMLPDAVLPLERFPLTPNGKVDRRALPAPGQVARARAVQAPLSASEETLAAIWRPLLRLEAIGPDDSFFDLGGNSLMATRLVSRIEQSYGIDFALQAVFETPQLAQMAARIAVCAAGCQDDALEALLLQLENLSDEQASAQLDHANTADTNSQTLD